MLMEVTYLEDCVVAVVRGIMRRHVVERAASRERDSSLETVFSHQLSVLTKGYRRNDRRRV